MSHVLMKLRAYFSLLFVPPLLAVLLYSPAILFDFAYDDFFQIAQNGSVLSSERSWRSLFFAFLEPTFPGDLFRPVTVTTYRLQAVLSGSTPMAFHLLNVLVFGGCVGLVGVLYQRVLGVISLSFLALLWFAVHPVHVEAVANIVGRAELLTAFFGLVSILCYVNSVRRRNTLLLVASLASYLLASLSKESGLCLLPLILGAPFFLPEREKEGASPFPTRTALFLFLGGALAVVGARWVVLGDLFFQERDLTTYYVENPLLQEAFFNRVLPGLKGLGDSILLLTIPLHLSADYSLPAEEFWSRVHSLRGYGSVALVGVYLFSLFAFRRERWVYFGLWPICTMALTANILTPIGTLMGERLLFLSSIGFCAYSVAVVDHLAKRCSSPRVGVALVCLLIGVSTVQLINRLPVWHDNGTLFRATVEDNPKSPKSWLNLGLHLYSQEQDYPGAEAAFRQAIHLEGGRIEYYKNLINALLQQQQYPQALFWIEKGLEVSPKNADLLKARTQVRALFRPHEEKSSPPGVYDSPGDISPP
ncbi:hypothetical protein MRY87_10280 [bacterium]|nr:hypothetical protein [bacterium]